MLWYLQLSHLYQKSYTKFCNFKTLIISTQQVYVLWSLSVIGYDIHVQPQPLLVKRLSCFESTLNKS
jgi:hypothetical protein